MPSPTTIQRCLLLAAVLALALFGPALRAQELPLIEAIRISGNEVTRPRIILQEMVVREGDPADPARIERSRQAIMDLGLFKSVRATLHPGEKGQILEIAVKEKYYFFPLPRLRRSPDGEITYGAQLRFDNLGGLNQKLRLTYKTERDCCAIDGDRNSLDLSYSYPRFRGSHYDLSLGLGYIVGPYDVSEDEVVIAEYEQQRQRAYLKVRHWLNRTGPSSGWSVQSGWFWEQQRFDFVAGQPGTETPAHGAGLTLRIGNEQVHDYLFSRGGTEYGYDLQLGLTLLGSDATFSIHRLYYRRYWPVGERPHQNLNFQMLMGLSGGTLVLSDQAFTLGGSRNLRFLEKNAVEGRSFFSFNIEYLRPLGHDAFRGVLFFDLGNAYDDNRVIDFSDLKFGAGLGFRYRLKAFVNVQIRADIAYDPETGNKRSYFGTKHAF